MLKIDENKLTIKQEKFCLEYAKSGNAAESYKKAGFKCKNPQIASASATRLLKNVNIQAKLQQIQAELQQDDIVEIVEVKKKLTKIIRQEAMEEVVTMKGQKLTVKNSIKDCLKAIELWGKMAGVFITKQELEVSGAVPIVLMNDVKE